MRDKFNHKVEYKDNYKTHEIREILAEYNNLLSTNIIDVPTYENKFFVRTDKRKRDLWMKKRFLKIPKCYYCPTIMKDK